MSEQEMSVQEKYQKIQEVIKKTRGAWSLSMTNDSAIILDKNEEAIAVLPKTEISILMSYAEMMAKLLVKIGNEYSELLSESEDGRRIQEHIDELVDDILYDCRDIEK